jgi:hypothetical protein
MITARRGGTVGAGAAAAAPTAAGAWETAGTGAAGQQERDAER